MSGRTLRAISLAWVLLFFVRVHAGCLKRVPTTGSKPIIRLDVSNWSAHVQDNEVARIILEDYMGYPVELFYSGGNIQLDSLNNDTLDANLEVWSDFAEPVGESIAAGTLESLGYLGVYARVGWYVPAWMVEQYPSLQDWNGLRDPQIVSLFKTNPTTFDPDNTRTRGLFYAGSLDWNPGEQEQLVSSLQLDFEVYHETDYDRFIAGIEHALSNRKPILFYFWVPHELFGKYALRRVALPPYAKGVCEEKKANGTLNCDYAPNLLLKVASTNFIHRAPEAYYVLRSLQLSADDQVQMLSAVAYRNATPAEAACEWVEGAGADIWQRWIPPSFYLKEVCSSGMENKGTFVANTSSVATNQTALVPGAAANPTFCGPCQPGFFREYNNDSLSAAALTACMPCERGKYAPFEGASGCLGCPAHTDTARRGAVSLEECRCKPGYFQDGTECKHCPDGAQCDGGTVSPYAMAGYWAAVTNHRMFFKCNSESACPGGDRNKLARCGEGYTGELCAACDEGYAVNGNRCSECVIGWTVIGAIGVILIIAVVPVAFLLFYDSTNDRYLVRTADQTVHWPILSQTITYAQFLAVLMVRAHRRGIAWVPAAASWASALADAVGATTLSVELFRIGCILRTDFVGVFIARLVFPTVAFLVIPLSVATLASRWTQSSYGVRRPQLAARMQRLANKLVLMALVLEGFWYISVIATTLEVFHCYGPQPVDGSYRLQADPSIECYSTSGRWPSLLAASVVMFCIHGIAYPAWIILVLRGARKYAYSKDFLEKFGVLFRPFKPQLWWWHAVHLGRKLLLSIFIPAVSLSASLETAAALVVVGAAVGLQLQFRPFFHNINNRTEVVLFTGLCINLICTLALSDTSDPGSVQTVYQVVFLLTSAVALGLGLGMFVWRFAVAKRWVARLQARWRQFRPSNKVTDISTQYEFDRKQQPDTSVEEEMDAVVERKIKELVTPVTLAQLAIYGSEDDHQSVIQLVEAAEVYSHVQTLSNALQQHAIVDALDQLEGKRNKPKLEDQEELLSISTAPPSKWLLPSAVVPRTATISAGMRAMRNSFERRTSSTRIAFLEE